MTEEKEKNPYERRGKALGVLNLGSLHESAFDETDVELLGQIGKQVAIAVEVVRRLSFC